MNSLNKDIPQSIYFPIRVSLTIDDGFSESGDSEPDHQVLKEHAIDEQTQSPGEVLR